MGGGRAYHFGGYYHYARPYSMRQMYAAERYPVYHSRGFSEYSYY